MSVLLLREMAEARRDDDGANRDVLELVREAMLRSLKSQKAAAIEMGIDHAQLSRQLAGLERLPLLQLTKSPATLTEFAALLAEYCGHRVRRAQERDRKQREIAQLTRRLVDLFHDLQEDRDV